MITTDFYTAERRQLAALTFRAHNYNSLGAQIEAAMGWLRDTQESPRYQRAQQQSLDATHRYYTTQWEAAQKKLDVFLAEHPDLHSHQAPILYGSLAALAETKGDLTDEEIEAELDRVIAREIELEDRYRNAE